MHRACRSVSRLNRCRGTISRNSDHFPPSLSDSIYAAYSPFQRDWGPLTNCATLFPSLPPPLTALFPSHHQRLQSIDSKIASDDSSSFSNESIMFAYLNIKQSTQISATAVSYYLLLQGTFLRVRKPPHSFWHALRNITVILFTA